MNDVKKFAEDMGKRCDVTITSWGQLGRLMTWLAMRIIKKSLGAGLPNMARGLRPCCLRILGRDFVILDFEPGCSAISAEDQEDTITHECGHAFDVRDYIRTTGENTLNWLKNYAFDDVFRCWAEAGPCVAVAELGLARTGTYKTPHLNALAYWMPAHSEGPVLFDARVKACASTIEAAGRDWVPTQRAAKEAIDILGGMK